MQEKHSAIYQAEKLHFDNWVVAGSGADEGLLMLTNTCLVISVAATTARFLVFNSYSFSLNSY